MYTCIYKKKKKKNGNSKVIDVEKQQQKTPPRPLEEARPGQISRLRRHRTHQQWELVLPRGVRRQHGPLHDRRLLLDILHRHPQLEFERAHECEKQRFHS